MQAIAEAVSLGEHLQIDRNVLLGVLSKTAVVAPAMAGKFRKIKEGDYSPEFSLRLMSKDMDLVMEAARKAGADLPAASAAQSVLASNVFTSGDLDLSAITPFVIGQEPKAEATGHAIRQSQVEQGSPTRFGRTVRLQSEPLDTAPGGWLPVSLLSRLHLYG